MKTAFSLIWTALEVALIFYACQSSHAGAGNIVKLFAGWNLLGFVVVLIALPEMKKEAEQRPQWALNMLNAIDAFNVAVLAYYGWWWCSAAFGIGLLASAALRTRREGEPD
jgi:hypothetical protein